MAKGGFYGGDGQAETPIWKESETQRPIGSPWRTLGAVLLALAFFEPLVGSDFLWLPPPGAQKAFLASEKM